MATLTARLAAARAAQAERDARLRADLLRVRSEHPEAAGSSVLDLVSAFATVTASLVVMGGAGAVVSFVLRVL